MPVRVSQYRFSCYTPTQDRRLLHQPRMSGQTQFLARSASTGGIKKRLIGDSLPMLRRVGAVVRRSCTCSSSLRMRSRSRRAKGGCCCKDRKTRQMKVMKFTHFKTLPVFPFLFLQGMCNMKERHLHRGNKIKKDDLELRSRVPSLKSLNPYHLSDNSFV